MRDRVPLPAEESLFLENAEFSEVLRQQLLTFNRNYQLRGLRYFAALKLQWERRYPGKYFPGLCAEVDSITGEMRPLEAQRAWGWGDTRALGIWCYFLQKGRIPDREEVVPTGDGNVTVNLREFYADYCEHIYRCLRERMDASEGCIPFLADVTTNRASDDPRNLKPGPGELIGTHIFAINAFYQYGMWTGDGDALDLADRFRVACFGAAHENRFVNHVTGKRTVHHTHGLMMVGTGALVDALKTIDLLESRGDTSYRHLKQNLVATGRWALDVFCGYHWNAHSKQFSEYLDPITRTPYRDAKGRAVCDPGHTAEGVGFFAEYLRWLPEDDRSAFRFNKHNTLDVLRDILLFVHAHGYSEVGVMFKNIDLDTLTGIPESIRADVNATTAPWWNVRECCAAAIKLYQLTGDDRMWEVYRKAFDATYRHYPNQRIGGLMVQNLDAHTLEPLPIFPATGNLDPMHSPRAREREIEALESLGTIGTIGVGLKAPIKIGGE